MVGLRWQIHCRKLLCRACRVEATGATLGDGGDGKWPPWLGETRGVGVSDRCRFRLGGKEGDCGGGLRRPTEIWGDPKGRVTVGLDWDGMASGATEEVEAGATGEALGLAGRARRRGAAILPEDTTMGEGVVVARRWRTRRALLSMLGLAATPKGTARVAMWALHRAMKSAYHPWGSVGVGGRTRTGQNN